jgi:O-antigen chain-terminating methyltransferase
MERLEYFSRYFTDCKNVLDIGCGEGVFLEIMKTKKISATGVDISKNVVDGCLKKGLNVVCTDAFQFLKDKSETYDGIIISNLVEHLHPEQVKDLLAKSFSSIKPNGILLAAMPDPKNIKDVFGDFWEDPTHVRMYPLNVLNKFFTAAGFSVEKLVEKNYDYPRLLWKIRDAFRNALIGPYWGRSELYIVGRKK